MAPYNHSFALKRRRPAISNTSSDSFLMNASKKKKKQQKKNTLAMKEPWVWVYFNNVILSCRDLHLVAQMNKVEEEEVKEEAMLL